ncbi:hypothetical protein B0F90DRAFT_1237988 [Multifurca ochricompacta]|uniref:Uncharacterized protein n=1 Tax=Multifurca ochricompacta TaxID=376703 RepID=A0AAD4QMK9_9AGAM|nr:hypothetical protein B0F90DRAFT_1237988 [Multifurca ochricompacta]
MQFRGISQPLTVSIRRILPTKSRPTPCNFRAASTSTPLQATAADEHHAYCRNFVQKHDYEAYLVSHLYPTEKRKGYFAIKAFYVCSQPESVVSLLTSK